MSKGGPSRVVCITDYCNCGMTGEKVKLNSSILHKLQLKGIVSSNHKHLVLEHVTVPGKALLEVNDDIVGLRHRPDLDPSLEVGLLGQL